MHNSHDALPLPPRFDHALAAGAILGYGGLLVFIVTQLDSDLRVSADAQFNIVLWCIAISGPAAICWLLRPHIAHLAYAMRLGRALHMLPDAPPVNPRRSIAARRWMWGTCGTAGACVWTLAAAIDIGSATGLVNLHGLRLSMASLLLCQVGAVCEVVRIMGPSLAAVDDVYQLAHDHEPTTIHVDAHVVPLRRSGS